MQFCVLKIIFELLQPFRKISQTVVSRGPSLRSWAGLVEDKSCDVDVDDELLPELLAQQEVRSYPFCIQLSSLLWSTVVLDR